MPWVTVHGSALRAAGFLRAAAGLLPGLARQCARACRSLAVAAGCLVPAGSHAAAIAGWDDPEYLAAVWETADGLPENSATAMAQTPDGYLWFGTFNGLVRFDGVKFTVFNPANTPALPSGGIVNVHADRRGRLWVSTYNGLAVKERSAWRRMKDDDGWTSDYARSFADRANGDLLITTFSGKLFEVTDAGFAQLPSPPGEAGQGYLGVADETGHWWAVQHRFIGRWAGGQWVKMFEPPPSGLATCAPARDGGIWLQRGHELLKLRHGEAVSRTPLPENLGGPWSLAEDRSGQVWLATHDRGFHRVAPDGTVRSWNAAAAAGSDSARFVFGDNEGNLWLGTSGDGLMRFTPRRFRGLALEAGAKGSVVRTVWPDGHGGVLAGTYGQGLFRVRETGVTNFPLEVTGGSRYLQCLLVDRAGDTWVGTFGRSLWRISQAGSRQFVNPEIGDNILALFEDSRGRLWVGGGNTLGQHTEQGLQSLGESLGLPKTGVSSIAEDAQGALWVMTGSGVFRQEQGRFAPVWVEAGDPFPVNSGLHADPDGTVWIGSRSHGLIRWRNGQTSVIGTRAGLPTQDVHGLLEDREGRFWLASNRGIIRVAKALLHDFADGKISRIHCELLDRHDGLPSLEFSAARQPNCARDERGRLWFATAKGLAVTDPAQFRANAVPPPVQIEQLAYRTRAAPRTSGRQTEAEREAGTEVRLNGPFDGTVELPPGSRRIEIHYTGLSFSAPEKVRFQVWLVGADSGWQDAETSRVALYENLQPGRYTFRARAANNDGLWNETGAGVAFHLRPHLWQTAWFQLAAAVSGLAGCGGTVWFWQRGRVRRALEREQAAHRIRDLAGRLIRVHEEERTRLARELHDDVTQRLARLAIDAGRVENEARGGAATETIRSMRAGLERLSGDVHALSYRLHPAVLDDLGLAEALKAECERFSRQESVPAEVTLQDVPGEVPLEPALCLFRVAQEALRNAARHARARRVEVSLRSLDGGLQLAVSDDGSGFDRTAQRERPSLGLVSMQERVLLLGGELDIESSPGQGRIFSSCARREGPCSGLRGNVPAFPAPCQFRERQTTQAGAGKAPSCRRSPNCGRTRCLDAPPGQGTTVLVWVPVKEVRS